MKQVIIFLLLLLIPSAAAVLNETVVNETKTVVNEKGIVLNASDYVQYKYDTVTRPALQSGEYIILFEDINSVLKGAKYDGISFVNPEPPVEPVKVLYEEKMVAVSATGLDPVTQAAISAATGAGAAYLVVRRKKV